MTLTQQQDKKSGRAASAIHMREDGGSYRALCTLDVRNVGNPREPWVDVPTTKGVTCRGCKAVLMARRMTDYLDHDQTIRGESHRVLRDFATWFEKNARGEHA